LLYIGTGVSGVKKCVARSEHDAGGSTAAWPLVKPIFQAIAAKVGKRATSLAATGWPRRRRALRQNGAQWHRVRRYAAHLRSLLADENEPGLTNEQLYEVFAKWYQGELESYLIEITRDIFSVRDPDTGNHLVDKILDTAGAKGQGNG